MHNKRFTGSKNDPKGRQLQNSGGDASMVQDDFTVAYLTRNRDTVIYGLQDKITNTSQEESKSRIFQCLVSIYDVLMNTPLPMTSQKTNNIKDIVIKLAESEVHSGTTIEDFLAGISIVKSELFLLLEKQISDTLPIQDIKLSLYERFESLLIHSIPIFLKSLSEKEADKQIISEAHNERLTLLGQMTSSFVHEFRNPLTSVKGFIQLLKAEYPDLKYLDIISTELEQLNSRISQFLLLSRKEHVDLHPDIFRLDPLIEEVITFLYPSIVDTNVKVESDVMEELYILGNMEEIRQVLLNITFNALDVLAAQHHPVIKISCRREEENVIITIANNGPKIDEEMLKNIFKPFYTTKEIGTGLGLFVCKEIIEKHSGTLNCESSDPWTLFTITLPFAE